MATPVEMVKIAKGLVEKTSTRELVWRESPEQSGYVATTDRFGYWVKARDDDNQAPWWFGVYLKSKGGQEALVADYTTSSGSSKESLTAMRTLYDAAKLSALGLGSSLADEVMRDLGQ